MRRRNKSGRGGDAEQPLLPFGDATGKETIHGPGVDPSADHQQNHADDQEKPPMAAKSGGDSAASKTKKDAHDTKSNQNPSEDCAASLAAVTCRVKVPMMGGFPFDHLA